MMSVSRMYKGPEGKAITEYKCVGCSKWLREAEIVWAKSDGAISWRDGLPWCVECCPPQKECSKEEHPNDYMLGADYRPK